MTARTALSMSLLLAGLGGASATGDTLTLLQIEPRLCVIAHDETQCAVTLRVHWQLPLDDATCLMTPAQATPLFCSAAQRGEQILQLSLTQDTRFELRRQQDNALIATSTVTVATTLTELRPRRRHGWGLF